ncbi:MAG TPA: glycosyltransferase family 4 protein [Bryobacteraceae bacterium]|nr:glycosyltransferase family 4 protein [Bryobacteraceae bacterium]
MPELEGNNGREKNRDHRFRLAFIVSHPIQYYAPLYQRLARRDDIAVKIFFTWHAGARAVHDHGFGVPIAWDIPLVHGYDFELAKNISSDPGTHHFWGLRNPDLVPRVLDWRPDAVHITGWAWASHLRALKAFHDRKLPTLFRGDSHLLHEKMSGPRWWLKKNALKQVYRWPTRFLVTGAANRAYYETFGVESRKLVYCPHSIDVARFAEPAAVYEEEARRWRVELGIPPDKTVLLFAGKFEPLKRPLEFMKIVASLPRDDLMAVLVGDGELQAEMKALAERNPGRFKLLPFQNQSRMPVVYRLGDVYVLPSVRETWGLAVNEALACGRPVLVSDGAGCARDLVDEQCGEIFSWDRGDLRDKICQMTKAKPRLEEMRISASAKAWQFDLAETETALLHSLNQPAS